MELEHVVPWGRSMDEYIAMFSLSEQDLHSRIVSVADGPASFNAEMAALARPVISVDPLYRFSAAQIAQHINTAYPEVMQQVEKHQQDFIWDRIANPSMLAQLRMQAMETFLADFQQDEAHWRYLDASLPDLPLSDKQFDLALCSHFLFLYSDKNDLQFHIKSCQTLCRIAREVRIYPLITLDNSPSPYLKPVMESLRFLGLEASRQHVSYQFQRGATEMLVIRRPRDHIVA